MKSQREKVLILVLPPLLVLAIYANWFGRPLTKDVQSAEGQLRSLQSKVGSPHIIPQKSAKLAQVNNDAKLLREQYSELERDWKTLAGLDGVRPHKIEQLADLLKRHDLSVIEQTLETGKEGAVPAALDGVVKRMGDRRPQIWRFRLRGTYASLFGALKELANGELAVTPLGLTLKDAPLHTEIREWSLVVWI